MKFVLCVVKFGREALDYFYQMEYIIISFINEYLCVFWSNLAYLHAKTNKQTNKKMLKQS